MKKHFLFSLNGLKKILEDAQPTKLCLVVPEALTTTLRWAIRKIQNFSPQSPELVLVPDGEKVKEWDQVQTLLMKFFALHLDRYSMVVAMGGSSLTDAVGFACSIFKRGIPCIYVPTTLLGQVDGSVGNKAGIDFHGAKNQIGTFKDPVAVVIDLRFLKSLSDEQLINGLGEIIKAGLIGDRSILRLLEGKTISQIRSPEVLMSLIKHSIYVKEKYSKNDPYDLKERQILNFGHTVGHAIELKHGLGHGMAVLVGCAQELKIGKKLGITDDSVYPYFLKLIENLGLKIPTIQFDLREVRQDKKIQGDHIQLPVVITLGKAKLISLDTSKFISLLVSS